METITHDRRDEGWDRLPEPGQDERLPRRPRRQFLTRRSAALAALVTCAIGFYAGIRVEKGQLSSSPAAGVASSAATRVGAFRTAAAGGAAGTSGASGSSGATGARGFAGATPGGFAGAGANASFGTVSTVSGKTLAVTEASGNTVKVKLSSATRISKTESAKRSAIRPGDTVVISGVTGAGGTLSAASITDSGAGRSSAGSGSSSSSGSSGSGSSGSAVSSLFSSGG